MLVCVDDAIRETCQNELRRKKVMFHQDNATCVCIHRLDSVWHEWDFLLHPPYSPGISPSNFYFSQHLQLHLAGAIFNFALDVWNEVYLFLDSRSPTFWAKCFERLLKFGRKSKMWVVVITTRNKVAAFMIFLKPY